MHAEVAPNGSCTVTSHQSAASLLALVLAQLWLPTESRPAPARRRPAFIGTPDNALALILGHRGQKCDKSPANGRRQIEIAPVQDFDQCATRMHALHNGNAVKHGAGGAIPLGQHENITFAELVYCLFELWPLFDILGAGLLPEDFRAPLSPQCGDLAIQMLVRC